MLETELKLLLSPETILAVLEHPAVKNQQVGETQEKQLISTYFDTAVFTLAEQQAILRVREVKNSDGKINYIQTLKTAAENIPGLQQRQETEAEIADANIDLKLLPDFVITDELKPVFTTEFKRLILVLQTPKAKIELALDEGKVYNTEKSEALCELELELLDGEVAGLFELAFTLAQDLPLSLSVLNKAERGYQLVRPQTYAAQKPKILVWNKTEKLPITVYEGVCCIFTDLLSNWQSNDKAIRCAKKASALAALIEIIARLQVLLGLVPALWPRRLTQALRLDLVWLKESLVNQKPDAAIEVLDSARYTRLWLQLCVFIVVKPWATEIDEEAQKRVQKHLRILARTLFEECMIDLSTLKKQVQAVPVAQICDQLLTAQKLRIYAEWFLGLYASDHTETFFTVLCQVEAALEELTALHQTKKIEPKSLPQLRTDLGRKLTELIKRFEALS